MSKTSVPTYVVLEKKRGETPLEAIEAWKAAHAEFQNVPASYAGRLDPMAEGKLLVLLGEECKKQSSYTKLDKEYEIEVLFDVGTDTGDVLGLAAPEPQKKVSHSHTELRTAIEHELGRHSRRYPVFSSKTVNGKPLFLYALEGTLDTITIPEHIETIYRITKIDSHEISARDLQKHIVELLSNVPRSDEPSKALGADFRQDAIRAEWTKFFETTTIRTFSILRLRVICGSGSYMRTLAERLGKSLGTTALALSIRRTKIGKYMQFGPFGFWSKKY
jgi:tRNA pseudouridine55 synthase